MSRAIAVWTALAMACTAFAQEGRVEGPALGLLYDPVARSLHRVNGVPAAALLGERLASADGMAWIEAAPGGEFALGRSEESGELEWITAEGRRRVELPWAGASGAKFSPAGRAALVLFENRAAALTLAGETPTVGWEFEVPAGAAVAISDDGARALSLAEGRLVLHEASGVQPVLLAEGARAAAFVEGSHDVVALTAEDGALLVVRNGEFTWLALPEGLAHPVAVAATETFILAAAENGLVARFARDGSNVVVADCGCAPATITRAGRGLLYRLNDAGDGPVWLFDAEAEQPRILFIPPMAKEAE